MVYTLYANNATNVILMDLLGKRQRRLSSFRGLNAGADLSPDGRWAALCLSRDRRIDLYLLAVESGRLRRLTTNSAVESSPCWSPDGSRICYVSDQAGRPQLYTMPARGGNATRLLGNSAESVSPDWSAVSNKICYATRAGRNYVLAVMDMAQPGTPPKIITRADGDWESPSWAPDGRHIVCSHRINGKSGLAMVDSWYGRILPVTQPADHTLPSWSDLQAR